MTSKSKTTETETETETRTAGLLVGRLCVSYDRGTQRNVATDLGLDTRPEETTDGKIVRGLGSHWRSKEDREAVIERTREEGRIRDLFKRAFVSAPFPGTYILPDKEAGRRFLAALDPQPRSDVRVSVEVYTLGVIEQAPEEVQRWSERIQTQLAKVPLGRGQAAGAEGLAVLENLAACPIITEETRADLLALIADAKLEKVNRVDFRRRLGEVKVEVSADPIAPRRVRRPAAPAVEAEVEAAPAISPRRRRRRPAPPLAG